MEMQFKNKILLKLRESMKLFLQELKNLQRLDEMVGLL